MFNFFQYFKEVLEREKKVDGGEKEMRRREKEREKKQR